MMSDLPSIFIGVFEADETYVGDYKPRKPDKTRGRLVNRENYVPGIGAVERDEKVQVQVQAANVVTERLFLRSL